MTDPQQPQSNAGDGPFGFNGWWDVFNGGGRGGTFVNPNEGYSGFFDLSGVGRGLGGFFAGPLGAAGLGWFGNWLEGLGGNPNAGGSPQQPSAGGGDFFSNPGWTTPNSGGMPAFEDLFAPSGPGRTVYVGNYGGAGDSFTNMFPNFGGDDVNMIDPQARRAGGAHGVIGNPNIAFSSPAEQMEALYGRNPDAVNFIPNHTNQFLGFPRGDGGVPPMPNFGGMDFSQFMIPMNGGGGGGGGGRSSDTGQGMSQAAGNAYLTDAFTNMPDFSIDPNLQAMINGLVGQGAGGYDQFSGQLMNNPFMSAMLGMLGGGSGGGLGAGASISGGSGSFTPNVGYRDIPPHMVELLDSMREANVGALNLQTEQLQDSAIADLYAGGVNRSDLALDEIGLLSYGQGQLLNEINAAIDAGRLGLIENDLDSQTALAQSQIAAAAQRAAASSAAGAQRYGANAGLLGSMFGDYAGALASGFGSQQDTLQGFAGILGDIGLGQANLNQGAFLGLGDLATRANESQDDLAGDRVAANAVRYGARLGFNSDMANYGLRNQQMQNDWLMNLLNFGEGQRQFDADLNLRNQIFQQGIPSDSDRWLALLGVLGGAAGSYFGNRGGGG